MQKGDSVAVKLSTNPFWITAVIMGWVPEKCKYEVMDAEDDEENPGTRKRYLVPSKMLLRIPQPQDAHQESPQGSHVLALFPGSSCFYGATVVATPSQACFSSNKKRISRDLLRDIIYCGLKMMETATGVCFPFTCCRVRPSVLLIFFVLHLASGSYTRRQKSSRNCFFITPFWLRQFLQPFS